MTRNGSLSRARAWLPLILSLCVPLLPFALIGELPGQRWLSSNDEHALSFAATGFGLLVLDVLLPVPSSVVGVMLGARLGWGLGFASSSAGLLLGHAVGYGLGRLAPERWAQGMALSPGWLGVLSTRPVPVLSEAVTLMAGASRMPFWRFASATLLGDLVYAAVLSSTGAALIPDGWYFSALIAPLALIGAAFWAARSLGLASKKSSP